VSQSNTKLIRHYSIASATSICFLSIQTENLKKELIQEPIGIAVLKLIGNYYQAIEISYVQSLQLDRELAIKQILACLPYIYFSDVYTDKDNYIKFNSDKIWSVLTKQFENQQLTQSIDNPIKAPNLRATVRPSDIVYRQKEVLDGLLLTEKMIFANSISEQHKAAINRIGENPIVDAVAGACIEILKIQKQIYIALAKQQNSNVRNFTVVSNNV